MTVCERKREPKSRRRRRVIGLSVVAGLVIAASAGAFGPRAYAETRKEPIWVPVPPSFRTDVERMEVRIGGHRLCIPANYLTSSQYITKPDADGEQPDVLVVALLPDLEGRTEQNSHEFSLAKGFGRRIQMLINRPQINTEKFFMIYIKNSISNKVSTIPMKEKIYGLANFLPIDKHKYEVFLSNDDKHVTSNIIRCSIIGSVPSPICRHVFVFSDLLFQVSYGRSHLPEWQKIKDRVTRLFSDFQACASPQPGEEEDLG